MKVYTYQIANWRHANRIGVKALDTTVKSGEALLAPTWNMVLGHKAGTVTDEEYEALYMQMLEERYEHHPEFFEWLTAHEEIALGCYCAPGKFCHRHLIVKFLKQITDVIELGEITSKTGKPNERLQTENHPADSSA